MPRIVIIAGEASGDQLGAGLIAAAKAIDPDIVFEGVGGPKMEAAGFRSWFSYERLAVFGLFEVLKHLPDLLNAGKDVKQRILNNPPDLVIGIDAPDFNLRVEKTVKAAGNVVADTAKAATAQLVASAMSASSAKQAVEKATGKIINPHKAVVYQGPGGFRTFSYTFQLVPKSADEAKEIFNIVKFLI